MGRQGTSGVLSRWFAAVMRSSEACRFDEGPAATSAEAAVTQSAYELL